MSISDPKHPPLICFPSLSSTNALAHKYAKFHVENGFTISSIIQTKGKGSHNRTWISPPGNLYCSIIINGESMSNLNARSSSAMILASLSVYHTLKKLSLKNIKIKWPNDILIDNKKVSGILIETYSKQNHFLYFIIGIGINLHSSPSNTNYPATSISHYLQTINSIQIVNSLQSEFISLIQDSNNSFDKLKESYLSKLWKLNQKISIFDHNKQEFSGIFRGINNNGALILENSHSKRLFYSGSIMINDTYNTRIKQ